MAWGSAAGIAPADSFAAQLRGLLRAAMEITAYGKLGAANLHHRYGLRDFKHPFYLASGVSKTVEVKAGFLSISGGELDVTYKITPAKLWRQVEIAKIPAAKDDKDWLKDKLKTKYEKLGMAKNQH